MAASAQDGAGVNASSDIQDDSLQGLRFNDVKDLPGKGRHVLVTGGAGYIGSHCVLELLQVGYNVVVIDNFCNSVGVCGERPVAPSLSRVEKITGKKVILYQCDLLNKDKLDEIFSNHPIDCVIHFAAKKSVSESMSQPLLYYRNNVCGTVGLLEVMHDHGVHRLVFSSSCTVYGDPEHLPISEEHPTAPVTNVYGKTKLVVEELLEDMVASDPTWNVIALRYFNPVGAHPSGLIGEDPAGGFSNIVPIIGEVLTGRKEAIMVYGSDYNTPDGTGVRDYIHVMDLAVGHVAALNKLYSDHLHYRVYNLGTGSGISVLELLRAFESATGRPVTYEMQGRRQGDIVAMYADTKRAEKELGWTAKRTLRDMCDDFWRWKTMNPDGYRTDVALETKTNGSNHVNGTNSQSNRTGKLQSNGLNNTNGNTEVAHCLYGSHS